MKSSDLTESEKKVWEAAATGTLVDLRVGDSQLDSPEKWAEWGMERTVRAEVIADLLIGDSKAASAAIRGVRLQGARIIGELNLEAATLRCPLALLDCSFASAINLNEATALSVRLGGSHVPAVHARQLRTRGDLRLEEGFSVSGGVEVAGAHIGGQLVCTRGYVANSDGPALSAERLTVDGSMYCSEGFSADGEVRLLSAHIGSQLDCTGGQFSNPDGIALGADGLAVDGSMSCGEGFSASGEIRLIGAHISGQLVCTGGQFSNARGRALNAEGLAIDRGMHCSEGFSAIGEVRLSGAHITGGLNCTGGQFSNAGGRALSADGLSVDGGMFCRGGFSASGEVRLIGAHITGGLNCTRGQFSNPAGPAISADRLSVDGGMFCRRGFSASGEVRLIGAHIGANLDCPRGQFSNPAGPALTATGLSVAGGMFCRGGFSASGEVRLIGAHIGVQLDCTGGQFSNPDGSALNLGRAMVSGPLRMERAVLLGSLDLTDAKASSYHDNPASWPQTFRLGGFVYDAIDGASAKERLEWLRRNEQGYSPQIYEQLAAVYRRSGHDEDARRVLIAKQRRRSAEGNLARKLGGFLLDCTVGYGYRTWLAAVWLVALLALGTILFGYVYRGDLTPASKTNVPPPFQPLFYTLDLLLPVVSLHVRDAWVAHGTAQVWSVGFIILGWVLATAVVLSLTGLLKRD